MSTTLPPPALLARFSASDLEPALRREAWREIAHRWVGYEPAPGVPLQADMSILGSSACIAGTTYSSAYDMRTGPRWQHPEDMVVLTFIQCGQMLVVTPARCALAPALAGQMNHMALLLRQGCTRIDADEQAGLLDATRALALLALRNLGRQGAAVDLLDLDESLHAGRHAAALRFMELHAHRHDLHAGAIAHGAGCSRSRLYAAFAAQDATVMGTLRELRLQRARVLIERSPRPHLGAVSWRCGFVDASGFSKLFRTRFGLSPSEWRQRAHAEPQRR